MPTLRQQYPVQFDEWDAAGGVEDNFRRFLLGQGVIKATKADWVFMFGQMVAMMQEVQGMLEQSGPGDE
jgi:hypothetical protein